MAIIIVSAPLDNVQVPDFESLAPFLSSLICREMDIVMKRLEARSYLPEDPEVEPSLYTREG